MSNNLEAKTVQLQKLITNYDVLELLKFISFLLTNLGRRDTEEMLGGLLSPQRQLFYLADLCIQQPTPSGQKKKVYSERQWPREWTEMKSLLIEIEHEYIQSLMEEDPSMELKEVVAAGSTFMNYFFNGSLAFDEQEIERLERTFQNNELFFSEKLSFNSVDFINFYDAVVVFIEKKLNDILLPMRDPQIGEVISKFKSKGAFSQNEIPLDIRAPVENFFSFIRDPGSIFILRPEELQTDKLSKEKLKLIFDFLTCELIPTNKIVYYTSPSIFLRKPIYHIGDGQFLLLFGKQILSAGHQNLFEILKRQDENKAFKARDILLEDKTAEVVLNLFKNDGHLHKNYSVDRESEQDILLLSKNLALIIEVKAGGYREPMRSPNKALTKIKSDFKKTIQYGYEQAARVEAEFCTGQPFTIFNEKREPIYEVNPQKYNEIYTIVVTQERFGYI